MKNAIGLNVGSGPGWSKEGWAVTDHKRGLFRGGSAWEIGYPDNSFDLLFSSHMLEHIAHFKIDEVFHEFNRVLKKGGTIRLVCPDLEKIVQAYVQKDGAQFDALLSEDVTIRSDLGPGGKLVNFIVSGGNDMLMFSRNGECIGGFGHIYAYDFEMLRILLERHGFTAVKKCAFMETGRAEFSEPLHPTGSPPVWVREPEWGDRSQGMTGFDRDPEVSLIVEAVKLTDDTFKAVNFGSPGVRGLDPRYFSWKDMTLAYLSFTGHKIASTPRAAMAGILSTLRKMFPAGSRSRTFVQSAAPASWSEWVKRH